jgi:hypothetical protein
MTYKKEEFFNVNGFINHIQIRSGDDDLFINEAATAKKPLLTLRKASRILNRKPNTRIGLSKRRHVATANYYKEINFS